MYPIHTCPATCELCGNWLPQHSASCPRNGVHPSQWNLDVLYDDSLLVSLINQTQEEGEEEDCCLDE